MTLRSVVTATLVAGLFAGCASSAPQADADADADADAPRHPSIAADASPVPAFTGGGEGWSIEIASTGKGNHDATLTVAGRSSAGTLRYLGQPAGAPSSLTVLNGELGTQPTIVEIKREPCRNAEGVDTSASVQVTVEGQPQRRGCGFLAVY